MIKNRRYEKKLVTQGKFKESIHVPPLRYYYFVGTLSFINSFLRDLLHHVKSEHIILRDIVLSLAILLERKISNEIFNKKCNKLVHKINTLEKSGRISSEEQKFLHDLIKLRNKLAHHSNFKKIYFRGESLMTISRISFLILNTLKIIDSINVNSNNNSEHALKFENLMKKISKS